MLGLFGIYVYIPANILQILLVYEVINFFVGGWKRADKFIISILYAIAAFLGLFYRRSMGAFNYDMNPVSFLFNILNDNRAIFLSFLNVLLFVPFSIVTSFYTSQMKNMYISFAIFAIGVEVIQLITFRGIFDLGDIVLYVIGFGIGLKVLKILKPKLEYVEN